MLKKFYSSALFFYCLIGFSQNNLTLKIEITSSKNEIINEGNAYLFNSETNQLIKIESIVDSHFLFTSLNEGNYNIQIKCEDFDDIDQKITLNQNLNLKLVLSKIIPPLPPPKKDLIYLKLGNRVTHFSLRQASSNKISLKNWFLLCVQITKSHRTF